MPSAQLPGPVDVDTAQRLLLSRALPGDAMELDLCAALGQIAFESHVAKWALPQWPLSKMDGYAVGPQGPSPARYSIIGESRAGSPAAVELGPGQCLRVSTGAVLPAGSLAVIPQEDITPHDAQIEVSPEGQSQLSPGRYIRPEGSDLESKTPICNRGQVLDIGRLSLLAATGHHKVRSFAKPKVGILSTGSELVALGQTPAHGQIVATNGMVMRWQCEQAGAQVVEERCVIDTREATQEAIDALCNRCDLVLTCGGISVGPHDHVLPSLHALGWEGLFRKVRLAPGRPTTAGRLRNTLIVALPGNPASSYVTFELFVRPVLRRMLGFPDTELFRPSRRVLCDQVPAQHSDRDRYLRVRVQGERALPLSKQQSGDLSSLCGHNALLHIPAGPHQSPYRALLLAAHNWEEQPQQDV